MKAYTFAMAPTVISGAGSVRELPSLLQELGLKKPILMTDATLYEAGITSRITEVIPGISVYFNIASDPSSTDILAALKALQKSNSDAVIALGGGSVIDVAKLAAVLVKNEGSLDEYTNNWGLIKKPGIPLITVPTTVGSGSEMTRGAVFVVAETKMKKVIVSDRLAARFCVLDPQLLNTLPHSVTAATGADALTQAIEGVLSKNSNAFTDAYHLHAIRLISESLRDAVKDSSNTVAMGRMQEAAAMVGAGMAYSGVGAVHAIANVLGGHYHIPHGVACASMLLPVLDFNGKSAGEKYRLIAEALKLESLHRRDEDLTKAVVAYIRGLMMDIGFSRKLSEFGIQRSDIRALAIEAQSHSDMVSNPVIPTVEEVEELILQSY